jgi:hypothetical protein
MHAQRAGHSRIEDGLVQVFLQVLPRDPRTRLPLVSCALYLWYWFLRFLKALALELQGSTVLSDSAHDVVRDAVGDLGMDL